MPSYILSPEAKDDLQNIKQYTHEQWGSEQTKRYLSKMRDKMKRLAKNPNLGTNRDDVKKGYFCSPTERHVIFYRKVKNHIEIISVIHQRMDVRQHL